ncbi:glycosyltransferase [Tatumella sp. JGM130]|uniref:glycosyltransferase n=1 Tax=Tatumella sp. JGM130 TaxID=2799797 RepID=UPI001BAEFE2D|nr:glycosyltransferase [Tatumella sp. JGM130]MBS0893508.1 glycosyltransferase [Tatumella sp. JGM130]
MSIVQLHFNDKGLKLKVALLVVLYGKEINQSKTLMSLSDIDLYDFDLVIFNNGPDLIHAIEDDDLYIKLSNKVANVLLLQDSNNSPLSLIYNDFMELKSGFDAFAFFDDDSLITIDYIKSIYECVQANQYDLMIPRIYGIGDNKYHYPKVNGMVVEDEVIINLDSNQEILSIGSGLVLFKRVINKLSCFGVRIFDERYALYGVDYSLFRKVNLYAKSGGGVNIKVKSQLNHDLSSSSLKQEGWRIKERLIDRVLSIKYYSPNILYKPARLFKLIAKEFISYRFYNVLYIMYIYIKGKHPRC